MADSFLDINPADEALLVTQLLCTRLCHDLAGPVGAVAAGVELTAGDPSQVDAETLGLIGSSSAAASRKLKFLRAALGVPAGVGGGTSLQALTEGYLEAVAGRSGVTALTWPSADAIAGAAESLGVLTAPLLLNLCLVVVEAVPVCRSLDVVIARSPVGITVTGHTDSQRSNAWRPDIADVITGKPGAPLTAKTIQAYMTRRLSQSAGGRLGLAGEAASLQAIFERTAL